MDLTAHWVGIAAIAVFALSYAFVIAEEFTHLNFLHLPPFLGMMTGLAYLKLFGHYLASTHVPTPADTPGYGQAGDVVAFDSFREVARAEWGYAAVLFWRDHVCRWIGFHRLP